MRARVSAGGGPRKVNVPSRGAVTATREDARTRRGGRTWGRRARVPCDRRDLLDPLVRREHRLQVTELHRAASASLAREEGGPPSDLKPSRATVAVFTRRDDDARGGRPREIDNGRIRNEAAQCEWEVSENGDVTFIRSEEFGVDTFF